MLINQRYDFVIISRCGISSLAASQYKLTSSVKQASSAYEYIVEASPVRRHLKTDAAFPKLIFERHTGTLIGDGAALLKPKSFGMFDYESELAFVIGRGGGYVSRPANCLK